MDNGPRPLPPGIPGMPPGGVPRPKSGRRRSPWLIALVVLAGLAGLCVLMVVAGLVYVGTVGPETFVVPGPQVKLGHLKEIRRLGLLEPGEQIKYFYSDAFVDIKGGFYFVTDRRLVLYSDGWVTPAAIIGFSNIADLSIAYRGSFFEDSQVTVELDDGDVFWFPLSSERGGDKRFFEYAEKRWKAQRP